VYCVDLLQFAFLHTFSVERVKGREALQNLAKLRGIYQIMKEKFYDKSVIHLPRQYTIKTRKRLIFKDFLELLRAIYYPFTTFENLKN
jgi:hypothetical protein